jgi:hypothetical protein
MIRWTYICLAGLLLLGCSSPSSENKRDTNTSGQDKGRSDEQNVKVPQTGSPSGRGEQPSKKGGSEQPVLESSSFFTRFNNAKEINALLHECVTKDKCSVRWGGPTWEGVQGDKRAAPRDFRVALQRPFRFRAVDGPDLACEANDVERTLSAFRAKVEKLVEDSGGQLREVKEELGLKVLDHNSQLLRVLKQVRRDVSIDYTLGTARGKVLVAIDLQEGFHIGPELCPFDRSKEPRVGVLAVSFKETVTRQQPLSSDK